MTLAIATIEFDTPTPEGGQQHHIWQVKHNLDGFGLDIEAAFINWSFRVEDPKNLTIENFCEYVVSKDPVNLRCTDAGKT